MTPEKGEGRPAERPATNITPNTDRVAVRFKGVLISAHDYRMARMAREIDWLEHHEHWWKRQLRWERERARGVAA